jgi:hypothetical protein
VLRRGAWSILLLASTGAMHLIEAHDLVYMHRSSLFTYGTSRGCLDGRDPRAPRDSSRLASIWAPLSHSFQTSPDSVSNVRRGEGRSTAFGMAIPIIPLGAAPEGWQQPEAGEGAATTTLVSPLPWAVEHRYVLMITPEVWV